MNEPKRRFFSGDTLQQALVQAANYFNLDPGQIAYRAIEKRHGFIKVRRKVVIEVDPEAPRRTEPAAPPPVPAVVAASLLRPAAPEAVRPGLDELHGESRPASPPRERRPASPGRNGERRGERKDRDRRPRGERPERGGERRRGDRGPDRGYAGRGPREGVRDIDARPRMPMLDRAERQRLPMIDAAEESGLVRLPERPRRPSERFPQATGPQAEAAAKGMELLLRISGLDLEARVLQGEERLEVDLTGADADWCFADEGELLSAFEHLLPRLIRSLSGEAPIVRVDCDNFHEIREERLRSLAQRMADEVRRAGRPRILEPMNPADRRIVHLTLSDDPGVVTESEGDGYFKRITIRPV